MHSSLPRHLAYLSTVYDGQYAVAHANLPRDGRFKRRETERAIAARMRSHSHLQKQSDAESWVDLSYHGENSAEASAGRTAFLAKAEEPQTLGASASDWVGSVLLVPETFQVQWIERLWMQVHHAWERQCHGRVCRESI